MPEALLIDGPCDGQRRDLGEERAPWRLTVAGDPKPYAPGDGFEPAHYQLAGTSPAGTALYVHRPQRDP